MEVMSQLHFHVDSHLWELMNRASFESNHRVKKPVEELVCVAGVDAHMDLYSFFGSSRVSQCTINQYFCLCWHKQHLISHTVVSNHVSWSGENSRTFQPKAPCRLIPVIRTPSGGKRKANLGRWLVKQSVRRLERKKMEHFKTSKVN